MSIEPVYIDSEHHPRPIRNIVCGWLINIMQPEESMLDVVQRHVVALEKELLEDRLASIDTVHRMNAKEAKRQCLIDWLNQDKFRSALAPGDLLVSRSTAEQMRDFMKKDGL